MKLYFATGNDHKRVEMERLLKAYRLTLPKDEGLAFDPIEDGDSFIANSIIKARSLYSIVKAPVLADDSGLMVKALNGEPGIYTARYGDNLFDHPLSSKERYLYLLDNLKGVKERDASFVCALTLMLDENRIYIVQEEVKGKIATEPSGSEGFGYDPIFISDGKSVTNAELSAEEKDRLSHRGRAARKMAEILSLLRQE